MSFDIQGRGMARYRAEGRAHIRKLNAAARSLQTATIKTIRAANRSGQDVATHSIAASGEIRTGHPLAAGKTPQQTRAMSPADEHPAAFNSTGGEE